MAPFVPQIMITSTLLDQENNHLPEITITREMEVVDGQTTSHTNLNAPMEISQQIDLIPDSRPRMERFISERLARLGLGPAPTCRWEWISICGEEQNWLTLAGALKCWRGWNSDWNVLSVLQSLLARSSNATGCSYFHFCFKLLCPTPSPPIWVPSWSENFWDLSSDVFREFQREGVAGFPGVFCCKMVLRWVSERVSGGMWTTHSRLAPCICFRFAWFCFVNSSLLAENIGVLTCPMSLGPNNP